MPSVQEQKQRFAKRVPNYLVDLENSDIKEPLVKIANAIGEMNSPDQKAQFRITSLDSTSLAAGGVVVKVVGIPVYISADDLGNYSAYSLTEAGWYVFARIAARGGVTVSAQTVVTGAAAYIATVGEDHVDVAIKFDVAALSQTVSVNWGEETDIYVFDASDLAIRNLDYRTTFYVYDAAPFTTWEYALTTDTAFVADAQYYTKDENDVYTLAVAGTDYNVGDAIPADTYYRHSKVIFSGMTRNVTYRCATIIDCPMEFILPEIEDETHGCWFEIRCQHAGEYSMTLTPPSSDVKIATEHTQKETAGINTIDLHYTVIGDTKLWRFMNTHSSIPTA